MEKGHWFVVYRSVSDESAGKSLCCIGPAGG
jgi:hypothetical protein